MLPLDWKFKVAQHAANHLFNVCRGFQSISKISSFHLFVVYCCFGRCCCSNCFCCCYFCCCCSSCYCCGFCNAISFSHDSVLGGAICAIHIPFKNSFSGSEWDYVILSLVRSLGKDEIDAEPSLYWLREHLGFLTDEHQMNVGLTRARKGLCIIGM